MDYLFPPYCAGCGRFGERFCSDCYREVQRFEHLKVCEKCGHPLSGDKCISCPRYSFAFKTIKSWGIYNQSLRKAIHSLKFKNNLALGDEFASHLSQIVTNSHWPIDLIAPVPISSGREKSRGYNQSAMLAFPMALNLDVRYASSALSKTKENRSQVGLSPDERFNNAQDAFNANSRLVKNKTVLVVDDVTTTGATLHFCAQALLKAGAHEVYALTLAKAVLNTEMTDNFVIENI